MNATQLGARLAGHKWWNADVRFAGPLGLSEQRAARRALARFAGWDPFLVGEDGARVRSGRWPGAFEAAALLDLPRVRLYWFRVTAECYEHYQCAKCQRRTRGETRPWGSVTAPVTAPWIRVDRTRAASPLVVTLEPPPFSARTT